MDVEGLQAGLMASSPGQRLAAGAAAVVVAEVIAQPSLGALSRLSAVFFLVGLGALGLSVEPFVTSALDGDAWGDLSMSRQTAALVVLAVVAIALWFAVSLGVTVVASAL